MEIYENSGKSYEVESVELGGAIINVNGTSITNCELMAQMTDSPYPVGGYTIFVDGDEVCRETFEEAYNFAMNEQKDTFSLHTDELVPTKSPDDIVKYEIKNDDPRMRSFKGYQKDYNIKCEKTDSYKDWDDVRWDVWEVTGKRGDIEDFIHDYNLQEVATEMTK